MAASGIHRGPGAYPRCPGYATRVELALINLISARHQVTPSRDDDRVWPGVSRHEDATAVPSRTRLGIPEEMQVPLFEHSSALLRAAERHGPGPFLVRMGGVSRSAPILLETSTARHGVLTSRGRSASSRSYAPHEEVSGTQASGGTRGHSSRTPAGPVPETRRADLLRSPRARIWSAWAH